MKQFLIKLKRSLLYRKTFKYIYILAIGLVIYIYMLLNFNWQSIILFIIYLVFLTYNSIYLLIILGVILLIVSFNMGIRKINYHQISYGKVKLIGQIIEINDYSSSKQLVLKNKNLKYILYVDVNDNQVGDIIEVEGILEKGNENSSLNFFNYRQYLEFNNIKGIIKNPNIITIKNKFCLSKFNHFCQQYFKSRFKSETRGYLEALLIGNKNNISDNMTSNIQQLGISHLFVISGLHMGIIIIILKKILSLLKINTNIQSYIITTSFILYYILASFSISILRVTMIYILNNLNKKYNLKLSSLNIYSLAIVLTLLIMPYYLFSYAFLLTYLTSLSLILISSNLKYKKLKGFFINNILISINSIIVTIPIIVSINPEINLLSVIYNLMYIPFVTYIMLPLSLFTAILPVITPLYTLLIKVFNYITISLSNINLFRITFPTPPMAIFIFYYLIYIFIIVKWQTYKYKITIDLGLMLLTLIIVWSNLIIIDPKDEIIFMNLPKGEATLIKRSFNQGNILIDTGENLKDDLELFLMKKGVKRLDYIFISHSDSDHNGKLASLVKKFKVKNVVINPYDNVTVEILNNVKFKGKLIKMHQNDEIVISNIFVKALLPNNDTKNANNNSLVLKVNAFNYKILFTGDIEKSQEQKLIKAWPKLNVDIFKVPHHGSNTSSSYELLNNINFELAICMNGYLNSFDFPTKQTINKYEKSKLLITADTKTIIFSKYWFKRKMSIVK